MLSEFTDQTPMPFGKYQGKAMINVPDVYLLWLFNEGCAHAGVRKYITDNLESIKKGASKSKR